MSGKRLWPIAIAAFILLAASTVYLSAGVEVQGGSLADNYDRKNAGQQQQSPTDTATPNISGAAITLGTTYTVQRGDTLGSISRRAYGSPIYWSAICTVNSMTDCGRIEVGDSLTIPTRAQAEAILAGTATPGPAQRQTPTLAATPSSIASSTATPISTTDFPLTTVPDGTWLTGEEVLAGIYSAPGGDQCSWKRLSGFSGTSDDTIAEGLGVVRPVVEIASSDIGFATINCGHWTAVELKPTPTPTPSPTSTLNPANSSVQVPTSTPVPNPIVTVPTGWSTIVNERLGYSFAVPRGWSTFDLQSGQLSQIMRFVSPAAAQQVDDALTGPGGEYAGHLAVELAVFSRPPIAAVAGVGAVPLDDDIPSGSVVKWLEGMLGSDAMTPLEVQSLEAGTTNNLPSIQGIVKADLRSQGLFNARVVFTALRASDTAYILFVAVPDDQAQRRQQEINRIVGTFRPNVATPAATKASTNAPAPIPTATPTHTPTPRPSPTATPSETPTATSTPDPIAVITKTMNIRRGPGTSYEVVGTANAEEQFAIIGKNSAGDWWQIRFEGNPAWVYAPMVESEGTAGVIIADAPPTATPSPTSTRTATATPRPTATRAPTATPRPTAAPVRPGTHRVGVDIHPGLYIGLAGQGIWNSCYWERLKDLSGTFDSIIANENAEGLFYVEILPSDKAFATDCDVRAIGDVYPPSNPFTKLPPGMYLVGRDIAPGLYRGQAPRGDWCYWERLSSATGEFHSILANDNAEGQFFVSVAPSDFAVRFGCPVEKVE